LLTFSNEIKIKCFSGQDKLDSNYSKSSQDIEIQLGHEDYIIAHDYMDGSDGAEQPFVIIHQSQIVDKWSFVIMPLNNIGPISNSKSDLHDLSNIINKNNTLIKRYLFRS
jgi:hypothetical protein